MLLNSYRYQWFWGQGEGGGNKLWFRPRKAGEEKVTRHKKNLKASNDPLTSLLLLWQRAKEKGGREERG